MIDMNKFRACDAFEFVEAVKACNLDKDVARERLAALAARMKRIEERGDEVPSYLLAAYRGYEFVQSGPYPNWTLQVVKLDDRDDS